MPTVTTYQITRQDAHSSNVDRRVVCPLWVTADIKRPVHRLILGLTTPVARCLPCGYRAAVTWRGWSQSDNESPLPGTPSPPSTHITRTGAAANDSTLTPSPCCCLPRKRCALFQSHHAMFPDNDYNAMLASICCVLFSFRHSTACTCHKMLIIYLVAARITVAHCVQCSQLALLLTGTFIRTCSS